MASPDLNGELSQEVLLNKNILVAAGTATIAGVDLSQYVEELKAILTWSGAAADGSTTLAINFLDSADNTTFATLSTPTFGAITASSGQSAIAIDRRAIKRYLQARHVVTGTTATFCTSLILVGQKKIV